MPDATDVLVVGSGGAALVAAIRAHDAGARVRVLERSAFVGGTTAASEAPLRPGFFPPKGQRRTPIPSSPSRTHPASSH